MQARILDKKEEALWANFVKNHPFSTIHQTPEWGHFQEKTPGRGKYWIVVLEDPGRPESPENLSSPRAPFPAPKVSPGITLASPALNFPTILTGTLLVRHSLPKGYCWLYAPRGPLLDYKLATTNPALLNEQMSLLLEEIKKIAQQEKAVFLRIDPPIVQEALTKLEKEPSLTLEGERENNSRISQATSLPFKNFHFTKSGFQPNETLILDLTQSEQEILAQMKQKGRYNIKLAEKKGVQITKSNPHDLPQTLQQDLQDFYKILTETTSRDGFHGHEIDYYENMLEILCSDQPALNPGLTPNHASTPTPSSSPSPSAQLYLAKYNGQTLAGAIITYHKDTATYYYGASSNQQREVMAPYLLHWQIMQEAKQNGYKFYDLFGISPADAKNHAWKTVSEFKRKFGGTEIAYQKPQEYSFKKLHHLGYKLYKSVK